MDSTLPGWIEAEKAKPVLEAQGTTQSTLDFHNGIIIIQPVSVTVHPEAHIHPNIWCTIKSGGHMRTFSQAEWRGGMSLNPAPGLQGSPKFASLRHM